MPVSRQLARPFLSAIFVYGGLDAVRNPQTKVKAAEPVALPIAQRVPGLPEDPEKLVQINGAVQVVAGTLLALGKFRRLAALALIGSVIPTTYAGHRFWEEEDEATKAQQRIHFLKNLGLLGGLILAAVDTEGSPSMGWRARRNARHASELLDMGRQVGVIGANQAAAQLGQTATKAKEASAGARKSSRKAAKQAKQARLRAKVQAADLAGQARAMTGPALAAVSAGSQRAGDVLSAGTGWAGELAQELRQTVDHRRTA